MRNFIKTTRTSSRISTFEEGYEGQKKGSKRNKPKRDRAAKRAMWEM